MTLNNTLTRILISIIAIPLILVACIFGEIPFLIFALAIGVIAFWELSRMVVNKNIFVNNVLGIIGVSVLILNAYFNIVEMFQLIILVVVVSLLSELFRNKDSAISNISVTLFGVFYIALSGSTIVLLREFFKNPLFDYFEGGYLVIAILVAIWVCDSAAFFIGTALGKHKLFPRVSPNKSWEGAVAGFVFSILSMIAFKALLLDFISLTDAVIIGLIVGVFGQLGDLIESLIKRDAGVKDSSAIIPGHGGIFDRFDSLFLVAPIVYLYLYFFIQK